MRDINCVGFKRRKWITENYYVYPICHLKIINNNFKYSDSGGILKNSYYIFLLSYKKNTSIKESVCVGYKAARDFENLTGNKLPKLFNPLKTNPGEKMKEDVYTLHGWNETRWQLYNAVMLIINLWDVKGENDLFTIKYYLESYTYKEPPIQKIKGVNTILKSGKISLKKQLDKVSKQTPLKDYKFTLLAEKLNKLNIKQYFE